MSAMKCNPIPFQCHLSRLLASERPKKVAIIACVRKMIVTLNSMPRDEVMWDATTINN
jgi:transposase